MKKVREFFYLASAIGSGICLVLMTLLILAQIVSRSLGIIIPSSEDFAAWILSAIIFFGLAYTFNSGGHIRVTILLSRLTGKTKYIVESINLLVGIMISAYLAYYTIFTVYESYTFNDVTDTYLPMPLWVVQLPMAIGSFCLFIAIVDNFVSMLMGKTPSYIASENELDLEG